MARAKLLLNLSLILSASCKCTWGFKLTPDLPKVFNPIPDSTQGTSQRSHAFKMGLDGVHLSQSATNSFYFTSTGESNVEIGWENVVPGSVSHFSIDGGLQALKASINQSPLNSKVPFNVTFTPEYPGTTHKATLKFYLPDDSNAYAMIAFNGVGKGGKFHTIHGMSAKPITTVFGSSLTTFEISFTNPASLRPNDIVIIELPSGLSFPEDSTCSSPQGLCVRAPVGGNVAQITLAKKKVKQEIMVVLLENVLLGPITPESPPRYIGTTQVETRFCNQGSCTNYSKGAATGGKQHPGSRIIGKLEEEHFQLDATYSDHNAELTVSFATPVGMNGSNALFEIEILDTSSGAQWNSSLGLKLRVPLTARFTNKSQRMYQFLAGSTQRILKNNSIAQIALHAPLSTGSDAGNHTSFVLSNLFTGGVAAVAGLSADTAQIRLLTRVKRIDGTVEFQSGESTAFQINRVECDGLTTLDKLYAGNKYCELKYEPETFCGPHATIVGKSCILNCALVENKNCSSCTRANTTQSEADADESLFSITNPLAQAVIGAAIIVIVAVLLLLARKQKEPINKKKEAFLNANYEEGVEVFLEGGSAFRLGQNVRQGHFEVPNHELLQPWRSMQTNGSKKGKAKPRASIFRSGSVVRFSMINRNAGGQISQDEEPPKNKTHFYPSEEPAVAPAAPPPIEEDVVSVYSTLAASSTKSSNSRGVESEPGGFKSLLHDDDESSLSGSSIYRVRTSETDSVPQMRRPPSIDKKLWDSFTPEQKRGVIAIAAAPEQTAATPEQSQQRPFPEERNTSVRAPAPPGTSLSEFLKSSLPPRVD